MTELTPELAVKLLRNANFQRGVLIRTLLDMLADYESLNGTVIHLGDDGNLLNGHHRCVLVALTGQPLNVHLVYEDYRIETER